VTDYGFPSRYKLLKTDDFSSVFSFRQRIFGDTLTMLVMPNERDYPRLGIVVSKKTARRAVARNYMRRVVREWFRHHREQVLGHDLVIRVNKPFGRADFDQVQAELARLLEKLKQRYGRQQENKHDQAADLAG